MYRIQKTILVSASHKLELSYPSECSNRHGQNWVITVYLQAKKLDGNGMIADFAHIKKKIKRHLDHKYLNYTSKEIGNPTAENIAKFVCDMIDYCYRVDVEECPGSLATYIEEGFGEL